MTTETIVAARPRIGEYVASLGGIYCGRLIDEHDRPYALIVARSNSGEFCDTKWDTAIQQCAALRINGFADWTLPTRMEALAMWQRLREPLKNTENAFAEDWYWTSEQSAVGPAYAWFQSFNSGSQNSLPKDLNYRARAVRRLLVIE
jgi:hypothetical protein